MTTERVGQAAPGADQTQALPLSAVVRVAAPTERRNPATVDLDRASTREILQLINEEDRRVPHAVAAVLDRLAVAADLAVDALRAGRRVHYFGAGTSGRLGVLDAVELAPTYNAPDDWFCAHIAGGPPAMWRAVEDAEDDVDAGETEARACLRSGDVAVGIAASGRTPFVVAALRAAREIGAHTVLVSNNPAAVAARDVDVFVGVDTGPEVVTGSTRMKAATAQKLILNAFSTAVMVKLGRVYSNFMVSVVATNAKLRGRMIAILSEATGCDDEVCQAVLAEAGGDLKVALVSLLAGVGVGASREALVRSDDRVRDALALLAAA